ncbi:MAG: hypothetical protein HWE26_08875, partial [Alteromonadaceae bacterium]|nr:hypothetical protein [Alteromonadaceae bacterium]
IRELKQWQTQHKQALKELFNDRVPEHFAEGFLAKATEDNAFLNEVQQNLNPDRNDQWHMQMEQRLSDMIQLHELSNRIEILSLTCKQSTCEIVGKAFEEGPWTTIYMSMIRRLLQAGDSLNMQKGKRVTYFDQEQEYFYSQLVFE